MKKLLVLLTVFMVVSCAPIYVKYDYEKQTNFSKYKTYNYYSDLETGLSELDTKRLLNALDEALSVKGLALSDTPDFFVDITSSEFQNTQRNSVGVGVGGSGRNVGGGISIGLPIGQPKLNREIVFDFHDENGIGLFWQAVSESGYNPNASSEQKEIRIKAIVEKVLKGYPPKNN
ncbi:DUF4136 domain-containing protein [Pontimicrobium sp. SW4]|uniref:DUF4136 domain-containing protein n=1 Tax=Pontimicrobium sp. SW4 TaxID=3153519 RepID=A0AAU7BPZ3_9FLAO